MAESEKSGKGEWRNAQEAKKEECNRIYHVIVRGIGQQDIFHGEDDFQSYLETTNTGIGCTKQTIESFKK